ncbi:TetR/AcrR family transcriptional regulator [Pygmaiobacter massiliensis]|uniref:TetR/AcrR family transcriptional regulator n=1 Tax=Pygmaiobacter massiliensis TaxID=1917873 RepID=UPI0015E14531|nr:TetR/AcrR family transcriptional regulator [Pygmaiobacter massiliensis]
MNTIITSRQAILDACRTLALEQGLHAINVRAVAAACGIAVGSVYNYFPSKADLIAATIQDVWQHIFQFSKIAPRASFAELIGEIYREALLGTQQYPGFFSAHSVSFASAEKSKGRQVMEDYFAQMRAGLLQALNNDPAVADGVFDESFSREAFVDFVFSHFVSLLMKQAGSCETLLEVIRRILYTV